MDNIQMTCKNVGKTRFCASVRGHESYCDVTPDRGGDDTAMLPPEALVAALGNCLGMVIALTCRNKEIPYEGMEVNVSCTFEDEGARCDNFRCEVKMPEELDARQRKLIESALHMCKVGNTLSHGAKVEEVIL